VRKIWENRLLLQGKIYDLLPIWVTMAKNDIFQYLPPKKTTTIFELLLKRRLLLQQKIIQLLCIWANIKYYLSEKNKGERELSFQGKINDLLPVWATLA
jgi:hypothetical protein